ncbi:SGNH/GDSL hydrolase family protein [Aureibaculum sp. 2210JD6-5]|uniref:SGNH/GDSL hydrolase family protein n=1 Tax=Aureibaculum sp. 2210JD6-5 TaxID=3103957 RepID=UPI002AADB46F|nr:SGNH/GDSL hydrolase family protein [Aureibaculum sp. 2210JD6-5]MDY7394167.1 SGNH/GDSL hydrolase family protein [Aureibaculum sp. 2210JD6-5]
MMRLIKFLFFLVFFSQCSAEDTLVVENDDITFENDSTAIISDTTSTTSLDTTNTMSNSTKFYLALGDSYTVAESVDSSESFPAQLVKCLKENHDLQLDLEIIATTGWTTGDLLKAIDYGTKRSTYDFVTLLIGVNNQYQGKSFDIYKREFTSLLEKSIKMANNKKKNVIVISIPDYAYTPFGQGNSNSGAISKEIDEYNHYAEKTAKANDVKFINITDITRKGLQDKELVASDGLHPSGKAYKQFVERICPAATSIVK